MDKFQGPVLARNQVRGITHTTIDSRRDLGSEQLPDLDPLTQPITQWLAATSSPRRLVNFYFARMRRHFDEHGNAWKPPLGTDPATYLKAAQTLLAEGPEVAIRTILWALAKAQHPPSLQWIASKITEVQPCLQTPDTTSQPSSLVVMSLL